MFGFIYCSTGSLAADGLVASFIELKFNSNILLVFVFKLWNAEVQPSPVIFKEKKKILHL